MEQNCPYIPNTSAIPNILFDYWMDKLTPAEFKVLMCIARKTYGWHKSCDKIPIKQIEKMTGLSRKGIIKNIEKLIELELVTKIKSKTDDGDDAPNLYEINVNCMGGGSVLSTPRGSVLSTPRGSVLSTPSKERLYKTKEERKENTSKEKTEEVSPPLRVGEAPPTATLKNIQKINNIESKKEKIERAPFVSVTDDEHLKLKELCDKAFVDLQLAYHELSEWKQSASQAQVKKHKSDYYRLRKWVIPSLINNKSSHKNNRKFLPSSDDNKALEYINELDKGAI